MSHGSDGAKPPAAADADMATAAASGMPGPRLSICLITYNRAQFLESLLKRLVLEGMAGNNYEIVLCDNCSTDTTEAISRDWVSRHPQIRYFRQERNVGALNNLLSAYRLARGSYAVYLADDDLLVPAAVEETLRYLDEHPDVVVAHAPWEMWDDIDKREQGLFYRVDEPRVFARGQALDLVSYIIERHIFPEICIYRTAALHRMYVVPSVGYWAFVYLAVCLNFGQVAFLQRPFYRSVTRHSVGQERAQMGYSQVISEIDGYRAGLEVLMNAAFRFQGLAGMPVSKRDVVQRLIQSFIGVRLKVAVRFLKKGRNFTGAAQYLSRIQVCGGMSEEEIATERKELAGPMLGQTVVELCGGISMIREVVLCDIEGAQSSVDLLRALKPDLPIRVTTAGALLEEGLPSNALVLTSYASQRDRLIAAGQPTGLVVSEQELLNVFGVY